MAWLLVDGVRPSQADDYAPGVSQHCTLQMCYLAEITFLKHFELNVSGFPVITSGFLFWGLQVGGEGVSKILNKTSAALSPFSGSSLSQTLFMSSTFLLIFHVATAVA